MINSAEEFVRLRTSEDRAEYEKAAYDSATLEVWHEVLSRYPDMRKWVAVNKTVPLEVLSILARDEDVDVRWMVAMKRKLSAELFDLLSRDSDETVRVRIAYNRLAEDPSELVREALSNRARYDSSRA
jgi:hypothetical protein